MDYFYMKCLHVLFEMNWKRDIILNIIYITKQLIIRHIVTNLARSDIVNLNTWYHQFNNYMKINLV